MARWNSSPPQADAIGVTPRVSVGNPEAPPSACVEVAGGGRIEGPSLDTACATSKHPEHPSGGLLGMTTRMIVKFDRPSIRSARHLDTGVHVVSLMTPVCWKYSV